MPMAVPELNFTCSACGHHGRGPRVTTADKRTLCVECHAYERMDPLTRHYCPDWDGMAIDRTSPEYECCTCVKADAPTSR